MSASGPSAPTMMRRPRGSRRRRSRASSPRACRSGRPRRSSAAARRTAPCSGSRSARPRRAAPRRPCPVQSVPRRSSWRRCVSVPPVSTSSPPSCERLGERVRVVADLLLVVAERVGRGDAEARRLRGDRVHQRAALQAGEDRAVDRLRVLLAAEDEAGARAGERLVRRRGDEVAVLDRVRAGARRRRARRSAPCRRAAARRPRRRSSGTPTSRPCAGRRSRRRRSASAGAPSRAGAPRRSRRGSSRGRRRSGRSCRGGPRS